MYHQVVSTIFHLWKLILSLNHSIAVAIVTICGALFIPKNIFLPIFLAVLLVLCRNVIRIHRNGRIISWKTYAFDLMFLFDAFRTKQFPYKFFVSLCSIGSRCKQFKQMNCTNKLKLLCKRHLDPKTVIRQSTLA